MESVALAGLVDVKITRIFKFLAHSAINCQLNPYFRYKFSLRRLLKKKEVIFILS